MTWETMWVSVYTLAQTNNDDQAHVNACTNPLLLIVLFHFLGTKTGVVIQRSIAGLASRKYYVSTPGLKALYTSPPGRPVHSNAVSISLGSIQ